MLPTNDETDGRLTDSVLIAESLLANTSSRVSSTDDFDLAWCELGTTIPGTLVSTTFPVPVVLVLDLASEEQMRRSDAGRIVTAMTDEHTIRNRAEVNFPGDTMRPMTALVETTNDAITVPVVASSPVSNIHDHVRPWPESVIEGLGDVGPARHGQSIQSEF